jgi:hypothetical protein
MHLVRRRLSSIRSAVSGPGAMITSSEIPTNAHKWMPTRQACHTAQGQPPAGGGALAPPGLALGAGVSGAGVRGTPRSPPARSRDCAPAVRAKDRGSRRDTRIEGGGEATWGVTPPQLHQGSGELVVKQQKRQEFAAGARRGSDCAGHYRKVDLSKPPDATVAAFECRFSEPCDLPAPLWGHERALDQTVGGVAARNPVCPGRADRSGVRCFDEERVDGGKPP